MIAPLSIPIRRAISRSFVADPSFTVRSAIASGQLIKLFRLHPLSWFCDAGIWEKLDYWMFSRFSPFSAAV
jgi:hypothetical protein